MFNIRVFKLGYPKNGSPPVITFGFELLFVEEISDKVKEGITSNTFESYQKN